MKSHSKMNLTQQLTHDIGTTIVQGKYNESGRLPSEADLCAEYEVSRTAMREAVKMLSAKGMISSRPKQGIKVEPQSRWNMFDTDVLEWILSSSPSLALLKEFTQMRFAIEPQAAALAATNATAQDIALLQRAIERMENAVKGLDDPFESDVAFHSNILQASHNRFFAQMIEFTGTALRVSVRYTNRIKGVTTADVDKHRCILTAIQNRDGDTARQAVEALLGEALALIESELSSEE